MRAVTDTYATDQDGVRRWIRAGDEIPDTWTPEDPKAVEHEQKAPAKHAPAKKASKAS
jgi:hypothetical protein